MNDIVKVQNGFPIHLPKVDGSEGENEIISSAVVLLFDTFKSGFSQACDSRKRLCD